MNLTAAERRCTQMRTETAWNLALIGAHPGASAVRFPALPCYNAF